MLKLMLLQKMTRTILTGRKVDEKNQDHYECNGLFWFAKSSVITIIQLQIMDHHIRPDLAAHYLIACACCWWCIHGLRIGVPLTFKLITIFQLFIIYWLTRQPYFETLHVMTGQRIVFYWFHFVMTTLLFTNGYFD
jgi:hypothetical protein